MRYNRSSGWGLVWVALKINCVRNIPSFTNAAQPQSLNRFLSFSFKNIHCNLVMCTSNPYFETMLSDGVHPQLGFSNVDPNFTTNRYNWNFLPNRGLVFQMFQYIFSFINSILKFRVCKQIGPLAFAHSIGFTQRLRKRQHLDWRQNFLYLLFLGSDGYFRWKLNFNYFCDHYIIRLKKYWCKNMWNRHFLKCLHTSGVSQDTSHKASVFHCE